MLESFVGSLRGQANLRVVVDPERAYQACFFALLSHIYNVCLDTVLCMHLNYSNGSQLFRPQLTSCLTQYDCSFCSNCLVRGWIFCFWALCEVHRLGALRSDRDPKGQSHPAKVLPRATVKGWQQSRLKYFYNKCGYSELLSRRQMFKLPTTSAQ